MSRKTTIFCDILAYLAIALIAALIAMSANAPHLPPPGTGSNPCYIAKQCQPDGN